MNFLKPAIAVMCLSALAFNALAQDALIVSPDKQLKVSLYVVDGKPVYNVTYKDKIMLENSPLGLVTNEGDFSTGMKFESKTAGIIEKDYKQDKIKRSQIHYSANRLVATYENAKKNKLNIEFQVSNNDIAFRYEVMPMGERLAVVVEKEATGFKCGYNGNLLFFSKGKLISNVSFNYAEEGCKHFILTVNEKLVSTTMSNEAADFLKSLLEGKDWY